MFYYIGQSPVLEFRYLKKRPNTLYDRQYLTTEMGIKMILKKVWTSFVQETNKICLQTNLNMGKMTTEFALLKATIWLVMSHTHYNSWTSHRMLSFIEHINNVSLGESINNPLDDTKVLFCEQIQVFIQFWSFHLTGYLAGTMHTKQVI